MATALVRVLVGGVLLAGLAGKLAAPAAGRRALANLGVRGPRAQWLAWLAALAAELACLPVLALAPRAALVVPAAVLLAFAAVLALALRRGAGGRACGCFGSRGTVSRAAVARNAGLAALLLGAALAPSGRLDGQTLQWTLIAGLAAAVGGLGVAVLALAREIGALRIAVGSTGVPLELEHEGPPVGSRVGVGDWVADDHRGLAVAIFTSAGCAMCQGLGPAIAYLAQDPWLAVARFDEERDRPAWAAFAVPGSPYAVVLEADGTVLAKGTFNGLPQLEGLVAAGARRREGVPADA